MALLSDFIPSLGAPDRRTTYTYASYPSGGNHTWLSGARIARVTVVGAGGGGGATGKYLSGDYYYNAGGGGSAGETVTAFLNLNPTGEANTAFIVGAGAAGAAGGASYFASYLHAGGGLAGASGSSASTSGVGAGGAESGLESTAIVDPEGTIVRTRYPNTITGQAGVAGVNGTSGAGGAGGGTLYGKGAPANTNPTSGEPVGGAAPTVGYGGGGSGGSWAPTTASSYTPAARSAGAHGVVIVEEWL